MSAMTTQKFRNFLFFFNDTATTEIYTLSLHDALPIFDLLARDLALEHDPSTFHRSRSPELSQEIGQDHVGVPADHAHDVLEVAQDRRLPFDDDVGGRDLEPLAAAQRRGECLLRTGQ